MHIKNEPINQGFLLPLTDQENTLVKSETIEMKTDLKINVKQENFREFEAREQVGIDLITRKDFNYPSVKSEIIDMKTEVKTEIKEEPFKKFEAREQGGIDFITSKDFDTSFNKPEFPTQNVKRKVKTEVKKDPYGKFEAKEQDGIDFVTTGHLRVNDPDDADESNNLDESYDSDDLDSSISSNFVDKQEAELDSPDEIDLSKNKSTDDEMSDASIVEEIDESMDLKTECFNFLNNYESSYNNVPDIEPIKTSNAESEKIPTNPIFLHCTICKNKHTRFLTQTELDKHMATFHVQKTVNGFKVISLSKNSMKGTKEIVFEKHESDYQMKDIQKKTEVEVEKLDNKEPEIEVVEDVVQLGPVFGGVLGELNLSPLWPAGLQTPLGVPAGLLGQVLVLPDPFDGHGV